MNNVGIKVLLVVIAILIGVIVGLVAGVLSRLGGAGARRGRGSRSARSH